MSYYMKRNDGAVKCTTFAVCFVLSPNENGSWAVSADAHIGAPSLSYIKSERAV
jgi:hypothetical protein